MKHRFLPACRQFSQRGFTLVELMVSLLIGLFLAGGLLTLTSAMKRTGTIQGSLSQLRDNQRVALTLITDVIQSAGWFPLPPLTNTAASALPVVTGTYPFPSAGQSVTGTGAFAAAAPADTITVRYLTAGGDGVINCSGNTSATAATFANTFKVINGNLVCILNGAAPVILVNNVQNLQVLYGVQTNTAPGNNSADTYLDATQMTNTYWTNVISVQVTLTFVNPLYGTKSGQTTQTPQTISINRVIGVMNKAGVNS